MHAYRPRWDRLYSYGEKASFYYGCSDVYLTRPTSRRDRHLLHQEALQSLSQLSLPSHSLSQSQSQLSNSNGDSSLATTTNMTANNDTTHWNSTNAASQSSLSSSSYSSCPNQTYYASHGPDIIVSDLCQRLLSSSLSSSSSSPLLVSSSSLHRQQYHEGTWAYKQGQKYKNVMPLMMHLVSNSEVEKM